LFFAAGFVAGGAVRGFDEDHAFAVFQEVGGFVEEGEPKEVVGFSS
jgi:hypothetical protein